MARPARVCRRTIAAMTANSSADIGMTRSRSVLDGAMTSSAMTSPFGSLVLADAEVGEFKEFLDPDPAVSQDLYGRPFPESEFLGRGDVDVLSAGQVTDTDVGLPAATLAFVVGEAPGTLIGAALNSEGFAGSQR